MPYKTKYRSFKTLASNECEGVDYCIECRHGTSEIAIIAIHGGGIEPGTSEIAEATAGELHSFYSFSGLKVSGNFSLHITSRRFDEPTGIDMVGGSDTVISIHGCGDTDSKILLGGRDIVLRDKIGKSLEKFGFQVKNSFRFPGLSPLNICNRCRSGAGVQLEICLGLRRVMFKSLLRADRDKTTEVFQRFVDALKSVIDHT